MGALAQAFPDKKMDLNFMWNFLKDLDDSSFLNSIKDFIINEPSLYPGTNIIALIREKALLTKNQEIKCNHVAYLEYEEPDYMFNKPTESESEEVRDMISQTVKNMNKGGLK